MKKKRIRNYVIGTIAVIGVAAAGFAANQTFADEKHDDTILDNIYIGEIPVGGMNGQEAEKAVEDYVEDLKKTEFQLHVNKRSIKATAGQLGLTWDNMGVIEEALAVGKSGNLITRYKDKKDLEHEPKKLDIAFQTDEALIRQFLEKNEAKVNQKAEDGGLVRENGAFTITGGEEGIEVNVTESVKKIADFIADEWKMGKSADIELVADFVQPRGSREELARVNDVLATFSTDYSASSAGRAMNVENGCRKINGTVMYPGDEFSVYEVVSPFDDANGYALAPSFENSTVVETYGGGICQVSTTLYNAVIRAELEVTERYEHSMVVSYVEPSMDAAIAGTVKDLKFVNNTDAPIYIEGITNGGVISFTLYGEETRQPGREVIFESEIVSETSAPTQIQGSASYNVGYVSVQESTHAGKVAKLWKVIKVDGKEQSREEFNNSTYIASPRIITVGTNTDNEQARAMIQGAIASQDESAIYTAAANAAQVAAKPQEPEEPEDPEEPGEEDPDEKEPDKPKDKTDKEKDGEQKKDTKPDSNKDQVSDKKEETRKQESAPKAEQEDTDNKADKGHKEEAGN